MAEGSSSRAGPTRSGAAELGAQVVFLREGQARAAEGPARSRQLSHEALTRPGPCQRNVDHPLHIKKHSGECEPPGCARRGSLPERAPL